MHSKARSSLAATTWASSAPSERENLQLVVEGKSSSKIGEILCLSAKSVETYRSRLMQELGIKDVPGLIQDAVQYGLITLES